MFFRHQDAVGLSGVESDARDRVATVLLRVGAQHRLVIELHHLGLVPVAFVHRVGEPDAALAVDRKVVRCVELLAVNVVRYDDVAAVGIEPQY